MDCQGSFSLSSVLTIIFSLQKEGTNSDLINDLLNPLLESLHSKNRFGEPFCFSKDFVSRLLHGDRPFPKEVVRCFRSQKATSDFFIENAKETISDYCGGDSLYAMACSLSRLANGSDCLPLSKKQELLSYVTQEKYESCVWNCFLLAALRPIKQKMPKRKAKRLTRFLFYMNDQEREDRFSYVIGHICVSKTPLTEKDLESLLDVLIYFDERISDRQATIISRRFIDRWEKRDLRWAHPRDLEYRFEGASDTNGFSAGRWIQEIQKEGSSAMARKLLQPDAFLKESGSVKMLWEDRYYWRRNSYFRDEWKKNACFLPPLNNSLSKCLWENCLVLSRFCGTSPIHEEYESFLNAKILKESVKSLARERLSALLAESRRYSGGTIYESL